MAARCPACGRGPLFDGFLKFHAACPYCGADFSQDDAGDGPVVFVVLGIGVFVLPIVLVLQIKLGWSALQTLAIATPVVLGVALLMMRSLRAWLFTQQYRRGAAQARSRK